MRGLHIVETRCARSLRRDAPAAERLVWGRLKNRQLGGWKFVRQQALGPNIGDFVCRERKIVIEIDGATHSTDEEVASDARRTRFLQAEGYRVIRITNEQVFENIEGALDMISRVLGEGGAPSVRAADAAES